MKTKSAVILFAAIIALAACNQAPQSAPEAEEVAVAEDAIISEGGDVQERIFEEETAPEGEIQQSNSMIDIQNLFSGCVSSEECMAVYPSCCKEAQAPFFINKEYEQEFIQQYKRVSGEPEVCPENIQCPDKNFGGSHVVCVSGKCLEAIMDVQE